MTDSSTSDSGSDTMPLADLEALVGHRFEGGTYTIAHWENYLLTDCTEREPMSGDLVHPIALFHVPLLGAGTSIAELFALGGAEPRPGAVTLVAYDWEYLGALREDVAYRIDGLVSGAVRELDPAGAIADIVTFTFEMANPDGGLVARVTNTWRFNR